MVATVYFTQVLPAQGAGHVLLTTCAHALGMLAQSVEIEQMEPEEGVLFLLRRAKLITPTTPPDAISAPVRGQATDIVAEMGGLPLALDQAGAYLEEISCSLSEYLHLYRTHRAELLKARRAWSTYHPEPVATTWAMALEKVQQANPAAVDLLNLCAFLAPDDIPEELFLSEAPEQETTQPALIKDRYALNIALKVLLTYSLLRGHSETHMLTIHRLVQAVIKDAMSEQTQ
jgi:hypothetical protein